jgi:poly(A) polymerase
MSLEEGANAIVSQLVDSGHCAYWAGGAVRDRLLGRDRTDIDVATSAKPDEVLALFPGAIHVGESFGVARVPSHDHWYEVATFRTDGVYLDGRHPEKVSYSEDPETDAKRRDFTVNALFYDPLKNEVLDFVGGQNDLEKRLLRAVGDPIQRFQEDRLRLLRAIRIAAQIDFSIEEETWEAIREEAPKILEISAERIRDELLRMLTQAKAGRSFRLLSEAGLMAVILPEVEALKGVKQPPAFHPEGDVFIHTMLLLDALEDPSPELGLAALLHDIGKEPTFEVADRIRFNNHDKVGAEMFETIARRIRLSNETRERVRELIAKHMCFRNIPKMRTAKRKRLFRSEIFPELLELHRLDCLASHQDTEIYEYCQEQLATTPEAELSPPKLVTGEDLIQLGLKPGPIFGQIIREVEDLQLEGRIQTREEALSFVRERSLSNEPS